MLENRGNNPRQLTKPSLGKGRPFEHGGERRIVTALCYDLIGSTRLLQLLDIEHYQELIAAFQHAAKQSVIAHSGVMLLEAGDGGVALFPNDLGAKDAASLAIRAGLGIVEGCARVGRDALRDDLHVRVGIATSVALIQETQGEPVAAAALAIATRLQEIAAPDTVLVSEDTRNLAGRSHAFVFEGTKELKGFADPEKVWRALGHKIDVNRFYAFGSLDGPFIGRESELSSIAACWERVHTKGGEILLLEGDAGIGKSRLLREVRKITRDQRSGLFFFQCLPGGHRATLHPLLNTFTGAASGHDDEPGLSTSAVAAAFERNGIRDAETIETFSHLLGALGQNQTLADIDPKAIRDKAHRAVFRVLAALCANGPIVVAVEDIHWIDPTSKDLLVEAARVVGQFPILLVVTSRLGAGIDWLDEATLTRLILRPLDRYETRMAIEARWPEQRQAMLPGLYDVIERISGGVPLFIEQIGQWISENVDPDTMSLSQDVTPSHLSAFEEILNARLNELGTSRDVARAGAVAGNRFTLQLLRALLPGLSKASLAKAADTLSDAGFLMRVRTRGHVAYGFRHALIQETIYKTLLRKQQQALHRRLFAAVSQDRPMASWMDTGTLAEHAERGGLLENAIDLYTAAGRESSSRSAMIEARNYLEHALALCDRMGEKQAIEPYQLAALTLLGPILTGLVGQNSLPARTLYENGVNIARRQPLEDQSRWFPIYWGWWLTGSDFRVMHDRALQVQAMLAGVDDPEIKLQVNHCIWAIDFNLGNHQETQSAIKAGLALYEEQSARTSRTLFGGHDAKVCGLGQLTLSLWLTGQSKASDTSLSKMVAFADRISHAPSKAHSLDTEAVSAFYRDDYGRLAEIAGRMADFAKFHDMQSLSGLALLFAGWAHAHSEDLDSGHAMFSEGLSHLRSLGAVADLPIYLYMQATLFGLAGKFERAVEVTNDAIEKARETGHAYWLAELYRRRAVLHARLNTTKEPVAADLRSAMEIAERQGAKALLRRARRSIQELGFAGQS
ncbi:ATP-binding protein [Rhizobium sp. SL42]|uniref:ATP-binding protein n=1 Tax=Rhizobium sp. SL42 TaxID=2806346 RepID=UPI001F47848A|nr:AAA family ATPase [Rhizobium sp. SL42]UJW77065.1 AAA family ATPase [Rhizobium sp. SL42]